MVPKQAFSSRPHKIAPPPTKQQAAYRYLKDRIMRIELPPGRRVVIDDIAGTLGLSAIPVREALQFLQSEGLVQIRPHAGATVSPITESDVEETFTILEGVEAMAVRRVCAKPAPQLLAQLTELLERMDLALGKKNVETWSRLNMEFHLAVARATGMPRILEITERALGDWDRIRRYFFSDRGPHRMDDAHQEHHQLVQAIERRDSAQAEKLIRQHNQAALAHYLSSMPGGTDRASLASAGFPTRKAGDLLRKRLTGERLS
jgi:DNA-binding GntR family transcriptional regulator